MRFSKTIGKFRIISLPIVACGVLTQFGWTDGAVAGVVQSSLTLEGQLLSSRVPNTSQQKRFGISETGRTVVIDEVALVGHDVRGPVVSFATPAFVLEQEENLSHSQPRVSAGDIGGTGNGTEYAISASRGMPMLVVKHQDGHAPNHRFAAMPMASFTAQFIPQAPVNGRGFAIVEVGDSGSVMRVKLVHTDGPFRDRMLEDAIAAGISSEYVDDRRHGHTIYMVYEIRDQSVFQVGEFLVTQPDCGGICP